MKALLLVSVAAVSIGGCASNLKSVRDFADETKKISVAFDPFLSGTEDQCKTKFLMRRIYTGEAPISQFNVAKMEELASEICKPITEENPTAKGISNALVEYANKLSAIAGDGVASSVNDDYDSLASKINEFKDVPKEKVEAITSLFKFLTKVLIAQDQRQAIKEMLSHEEAVGALGDALVKYTERVYGGYVKESLKDNKEIAAMLQTSNTPELLTKLQLVEFYKQELKLQNQEKSIQSLRSSVEQMKITMKDLRSNLDNLSDEQRKKEVEKLVKEVKSLYQQLAKSF